MDSPQPSLASARGDVKPRPTPASRRNTLPLSALSLLLLVTVVVGFIWHDLREAYRDTLHYWDTHLSSSAEEHASFAALWLLERRTDTMGVAHNPETVHFLAAGRSSVAKVRKAAEGVVENMARENGLLGGALADRECRSVLEVGVPAGANAGVQQACRSAQAAGDFSVFASGMQQGPVWLNLAFPVLTAKGAASSSHTPQQKLGAAVLIAEPWKTVLPSIASESGRKENPETLVVWEEGGEAMIFSPRLAGLKGATAVLQRPLNEPTFESRVAREGKVEFGEFIDYRGVRVFGAARPIGPAGSSLAHKIDRDAALAEFHKRAVLEWLAGALSVLLFGSVIVAQHRHVATRDLKEKLTQQQLLLDLKQHVEASEERFRELVESVEAIVWEAEAATLRTTFVSQGAERILGFSPGQWLKAPNFWADHLHPQDRERALASEREACEKGKALSVEYRMEGASGGYRWFRDFMHVVNGSQDKTKLLRGVMVDITESKQAEEALRQSDRRYKDFISRTSDGIWRLELEPPIPINRPEEEVLKGLLQNAYFAECNLTHARIHGFSAPEEVVGRPMREVLPDSASDQERMETIRSAVRGGFQIRTVEFHGRDKAGNLRNLIRTEVPFVENGFLVRIWGITRDLTELKRAEEELRRSEVRWRAVFENSAVGIALSDPVSTQFQRANLAFQRMLGCSEEELQALSFMDITHEDDREPNRRLLAELVDGRRQSFEMQKRYRRKDGKLIWVNLVVSIIPGTEGISRSSMAIVEDISERKQAEEALRESRQLLQTTLYSLRDAVFIMSLDKAEILECNPAATEIFGYRREEMVGRGTRFLHVDEAALQEFRERLAAAMAEKGYLQQFEFRMRRKDGSIFPTSHSVAPLRDSHGNQTGWVSLVQDISERKRAEKALRESEELFRTTFETAGIGMALVDIQGHPSRSNPALQRILGYSQEELSRMAFTEFTHPDDRERDWDLYQELLAGKREKYEIEKRYLKKDGQVAWGLLTVSLIKGGEERPKFAVGMVQDITERQRAQEDRQRSLDQLRALAGRLQTVREEERKRVAREIHDQLGQALTAIKLDLSSLARDWPAAQKPEQARRASAILQLVDEMIQTVRRISTELRPGMLDDLGLAATVEWAAEEFAARTGTECRLDLPQQPISVEPETATAVFRIFQETLTNVARHAEASEVNVRLAQEDGGLILEVQDNGRGIAEDKISSVGSLGILGMRERALLLGGELTVSGIPRKGTTVRVRVPEASDGMLKNPPALSS